MNDRTTLRTAILMNWLGFFYQPFDIATTLTTLEGENGAGKTTVMIAAYVVLMPDLNLLRFRNVSESTEGENITDKGLYGRLGVKGVSYTLLEFITPDGTRIIAGVQLLRHREPKIELKTFIIHGLKFNLNLQNVLLIQEGDLERIPQLTELRQQVAIHGARLETFDSVGHYEAALFELGIMPMRMETHNERDKFNKMLNTSMYGGLSSSIQKSLRDYLLNEDLSLRNHVARMRENLEACRVTRREIANAQQQYDSIKEIFETGYTMFEAGFHGTRIRAREFRAIADRARAAHRQSQQKWKDAKQKLFEVQERNKKLEAELAQKQEDSREAERLYNLCKKAFELNQEIEKKTIIHQKAQQQLLSAIRELEQKRTARDEAEKALHRLLEKKDSLANELADSQRAWQEVESKVASYRTACRTLADVQKALTDIEVAPENVIKLAEQCEIQWNDSLNRLSKIQRDLDSLKARKLRFEHVFNALVKMAETDINPAEAMEFAKVVEEDFRNMERAVREAQELPSAIGKAEQMTRRQKYIRYNVKQLEGFGLSVETAQSFREAFEIAAAEQDNLNKEIDAKRSNELEDVREKQRIELELKILQQQLKMWNEARSLADRIGLKHSVPISCQDDLDTLKQSLFVALRDQEAAISKGNEEHQSLLDHIYELEFSGGRLESSLVEIRDMVDGTLVAELYDNVQASEAARTEALLGPLHSAVIVEDVQKAAPQIAAASNRPETVWLIEKDGSALPQGKTISDSVLVSSGQSWRLSRFPKRPVIGRAARGEEIRRLQNEVKQLTGLVETHSSEKSLLENDLSELDNLLQLRTWIDKPDPQKEFDRLSKQLSVVEGQIKTLQKEISSVKNIQRTVQEKIKILNQSMPDAHLLDEEDWQKRTEDLKRQLSRAETFKKKLAVHSENLKILRKGFIELQTVPPSDDDLNQMFKEQQSCQQALDYWQRARNLLFTLKGQIHYFQYYDMEAILEQRTGVIEYLKQQQEFIDKELNKVKTAYKQAQAAFEEAQKKHNQADAEFKNLDRELAGLKKEYTQTGVQGTEQTLKEAKSLMEEMKTALKQTEKARSEALVALGHAEQDVQASEKELKSARENRKEALRALRPHFLTWLRLHIETKKRGFYDRLIKDEESYIKISNVEAFNRASRLSGQLSGILRERPDASETFNKITEITSSASQETSGFQYMLVWVETLRYLEQIIPRDIVHTDDPEETLVLMQTHLSALKTRLEAQEKLLRTSADSISNSISSRVRKEENHIRKLNRGLEKVSFGSIKGVRIHIQRIDTMQRLLDSLKAQPGLFDQGLPLEETMQQIYKELGGGQIKGDQLLDYRYYVRLNIEIQRIGSERWEIARAASLSTGESIGVGAAVLMVILEAWEQHASLLRTRKLNSSLRFLFLDEAARLSHSSLGTLTDFCQKMNMQLMVAAPAAERARQGITYRLVRRINEQGEEEVIVRGRRGFEESNKNVRGQLWIGTT